MFRNSVQPAMLPSEVAFVEGHDLVQKKKKKKRSGGVTADEDYFEKILKHDLHERKQYHSKADNDGDFEFDDSSNALSSSLNDASSRNDSSGMESGVESSGESSDTGNSFMGGARDGIDRMLKGKDGMEFISDIRCCLILGLIAAAATMSIGVYALSKNHEVEDFYFEVSYVSVLWWVGQSMLRA
jgi:hypothetical protein